MKERKVMKLASRGKRLGAFCIDSVIPVVTALILIITSIVLLAFLAPSYPSDGFGNPYSFGYGYGYGMHHSAGFVAAYLIAFLLIIAYMVAQMVFFSKSKTIGKAILGLEVVSSDNGEPIGFWKMLFREWIVKQASGCVFMLGYIWVLVDEKNRGWHDKILDTYVVDQKESELLELNSKKRSSTQRKQQPKPQAQTKPAEAPAVPAVTENVIEVAEAVVKTADEAIASAEPEKTIDEKVVTDEQE